jgi:AcrR family transcriptional regulator
VPLAPLSPLESRTLPAHTKGERTAQRILDVAEALFAERGFAGTTLRDVAAAAGLRNPSLYNHFSSKEALYAAVLERGLSPIIAGLGDFIAEPGERDASALVDRMMTLLAEHPMLPRLIQHETLSGGAHLSPMLRDWIQPAFEHANEMAETAPAADQWNEEQRPLLVLAMCNILLGYFSIAPLYRALNGHDLLSPDSLNAQTQLFRRLVSVLFLEDRKPAESGASSPFN